MVGNQKWRIYKADGLWKLNHPCGFAQHPDYGWIIWKAQELYDMIYREDSRGR